MSDTTVGYAWLAGSVVVFFVGCVFHYLEMESETGDESTLFFVFIIALVWPIAITFGILAVCVLMLSLPAKLAAKFIYRRWPQ